ncbi:integrin alpha-L-like, partial [Bufo gargarizans]|uniref:integrin alpha-L-like n=1 Tax=Bufo gargarizans TaxID=30331 RepID=UPI001CF29EEA
YSQLVVQDGASFSSFLSLHNMSLKARHTRFSVDLPNGLRFHKANVIEASHWISLVCEDFTEQVLTCNVTHPSLRRGVWAVIQITFSIVSNVSWAEHIRLAVNVTSDGNENSSVTEEEVPVLYPIHIICRSLEDSTKHMAFINLETSAAASHRYQIQNLRVSAVAINVSVSMWTENVNWDFVILSSQNSNVTCPELHESSANQTHSEKTETIANQTWSCILDASGEISINITGLLKPWKVAGSVNVRSAVTIQYNPLRYHSDTGSMHHTAQVVTEVEILEHPDYTKYLVGGAVGGLIMMALISFLLYKVRRSHVVHIGVVYNNHEYQRSKDCSRMFQGAVYGVMNQSGAVYGVMNQSGAVYGVMNQSGAVYGVMNQSGAVYGVMNQSGAVYGVMNQSGAVYGVMNQSGVVCGSVEYYMRVVRSVEYYMRVVRSVEYYMRVVRSVEYYMRVVRSVVYYMRVVRSVVYYMRVVRSVEYYMRVVPSVEYYMRVVRSVEYYMRVVRSVEYYMRVVQSVEYYMRVVQSVEYYMRVVQSVEYYMRVVQSVEYYMRVVRSTV